MVRAVNAGISAHIDARGRVVTASSGTTASALVVHVTPSTETTLATEWGEWLAHTCVLVALVLLLLALASLAREVMTRSSRT